MLDIDKFKIASFIIFAEIIFTNNHYIMATIFTNEFYSIFLDNDLSSLKEFLLDSKEKYSSYFILVDENTHSLAIPVLLAKVGFLQQAKILEIDAGEKFKNLHTASSLWEALLENNADRNTLLINLGGGVVSDMGGFVASVFKRGIPFINIPTSLLAMTDAAIGSKTGVDFNLYKNQIGSFAHPDAVFICTDFLNTLPQRELFSGMGEVLKYGFIAESPIWDVLKNQEVNSEIDFDVFVAECVRIKNDIVSSDWKENAIRKILNFGHSVGHAFESFAINKFPRHLLHGEAVALGIIVEMELSVRILNFDTYTRDQAQQYILDNFDLYPITEMDFGKLIDFMRKDKKNNNGDFNFVLLEEMAKPKYDISVSEENIIESLQYYANL